MIMAMKQETAPLSMINAAPESTQKRSLGIAGGYHLSGADDHFWSPKV